MRINRTLPILVCCCGLASAQTDAGLWRFVHPNAKALIGIDVQHMRTSRVVEEMSSQLRAMPLPMGLPFDVPGMDLIRSIDRVVISSPGRDNAHPDEEPPILIAISGHFEPGKLTQMFLKSGARKQVFDSVTIYRPQDQTNKDFGFAVLNSQTMLIGDAKSLYTIIDRVDKGESKPPAIVERARDMDVAFDFWAILLTTPAAMESERLPFSDLTGKLNGFEAGISVRDGLTVDVNLSALTEKAAKDMAAELTKVLHLSAKDHENHPELAGLDKKVKIRVDHADVHFALHLEAREVARMAKVMEDAHARRQALTAQAPQTGPAIPLQTRATAQAASQAKPAAPPPQQRQVIRIEGLDGGPREIPYKSVPDR